MDPFWTTWKPLTNRVLALAWFVCLTSFLSGSGLVASEQLSGADLMDMVRLGVRRDHIPAGCPL